MVAGVALRIGWRVHPVPTNEWNATAGESARGVMRVTSGPPKHRHLPGLGLATPAPNEGDASVDPTVRSFCLTTQANLEGHTSVATKRPTTSPTCSDE
ncbi:hypothetical protein GCM10012275_58110 [Longimycelium tulufanense]|uniref:Uncharacterized protein n=1 Tax=Longimycelium tulufanense TaxID=907463 RepID=A0A8J3CK74_9PSEU|nr:hypothetical protein GCM10012275_58110 [Longimycelium tulufanense]